jgi:LacI family repressor for deo operon, udp, cdd, tsx, nupC, and nupG
MRKKITLQDVAEAAGVSVITASRAIRGIGRVNPETRKLILKAARKVGYSRADGLIFPNSSLTNKSEHALRILLPVFPNPTAGPHVPFKLNRMVTALKRTLEASGGILTILEANDPDDLMNHLPRAKQHGIILRQILPEGWIRKLQQIAPVVYAISHDVIPGTDCVEFNEYKSATMLYHHLLSQGHRNILWVSRDRTLPQANVDFSLYDSLSGFDRQARNFLWIRSSAWQGLDLGQRDRAVRNRFLCIKTDESEDFAIAAQCAAQQILDMPDRPTAVVTMVEGDAYYISRELEKSGIRMPVDISFATYMEDVPKLPHGINFTCISMPYEQVGQMILEIIQRRHSAPQAPYITISVETALKEGDTVATRPSNRVSAAL